MTTETPNPRLRREIRDTGYVVEGPTADATLTLNEPAQTAAADANPMERTAEGKATRAEPALEALDRTRANPKKVGKRAKAKSKAVPARKATNAKTAKTAKGKKLSQGDERRARDVERIKKALKPRAKAKPKAAKPKTAKATPRKGTKESKIISMIERPEGASLAEIMKETEWQPHTVRGFISAAVKKKRGLTVISEKNDAGERVYRIPAVV